MKKLLSLVLAVLVGCSFLACGQTDAPAQTVAPTEAVSGDEPVDTPEPAQEPMNEIHESGDYTYTIYSDGTATITKYSGSEHELTVPSELDGLRVSSIGELAFYECAALTGVDIPDGVTEIGQGAFARCEALTTVTVPASVIDFGHDVFYGCNALTVICPEGSAAWKYATENGIPCKAP